MPDCARNVERLADNLAIGLAGGIFNVYSVVVGGPTVSACGAVSSGR